MAEAKYRIELFSGGEQILQWHVSKGNLHQMEGINGYTFYDIETRKRIQITGTIIVTEL